MVGAKFYLLYGKEDFLKKEFLQDLRQKLFPQGADASINTLETHLEKEALYPAFDFVRTAPFLAEKRLAVLWELDELDEEEKEFFEKQLDALPASAVLVAVTDSTNVKKSAFLSAVAKKAQVLPCHTPFDRDMLSWIQSRLQKRNLKINGEAAAVLMERVGRDLSLLWQSFEELSLYIHPRNEILLSDVQKLFAKSTEEDVFLLVDAILAKKKEQAMGEVASLLKEGVKPAEVTAVLAGQFDKLTKASELLVSGVGAEEVGTELKVHSFFLDKFIRQARQASLKELKSIRRKILACDETIKKGLAQDSQAFWSMILSVLLDPENIPVFSRTT